MGPFGHGFRNKMALFLAGAVWGKHLVPHHGGQFKAILNHFVVIMGSFFGVIFWPFLESFFGPLFGHFLDHFWGPFWG